ncbi:YcjF family protein [Xylanimonas allomyrinae]|nr:GTPase [Xylanimonas allomyrinae]
MTEQTTTSQFIEDDAQDAFAAGFHDASEDYGRLNIAVLGNTGVGKSTLVNAMFQKDLCPVGLGKPVTTEVSPYDNESGTLRIYDFPGFEHGKKRDPVEYMTKELKKLQKGPEEDRVHLAWFCWALPRFEDSHKRVVEALAAQGIVTIGIVAKVEDNELDDAHAFARLLSDYFGSLIHHRVMVVRAGKAPVKGLRELLDETREVAPDAFREALEAAQRVDLAAKDRQARAIVAAAAASAGAVAATPIPVASATILAPIQLGMMGKLANLYGLSLVGMLGMSGLVQLSLQLTGRAAAQSLVKLIPGPGSVVNLAVATIWTEAAGEAWIQICKGLATGKLDPSKISNVLDMLSPLVEAILRSKMPKAKKR